jgi:uncharacterized repeat protein (TIGR03803 family)
MFRRTVLSLAFTAASSTIPLLAQGTYWGMTASGGSGGVGTIYSITESNVFTTKHNFYRYEGGGPKGEVLKHSNGLYYGVTEFGGLEGVGILFSYNPTSGVYTVLKNFSSTTSTSTAVGGRPIRGVVLAPNGRLYGTCSIGGLNNVGTMWEYNIGTSTFAKKFDFDGLTTAAGKGSTPRGKLLMHSNGTIYGTAQLGGLNARGCIFSYAPGTTTDTKLYNFPALPATATGAQPICGLTQASNGLLYGFAANGGANGFGTIFSFNLTGNVYTKLFDFATATGRSPLAEFVQAPNSVLYAAASAGGANSAGVIFSWNIGTATYTDLVDLDNAGGYSPFSRMIVGSSGLLYGTTSAGGPNDAGAIYSFNTTTNAYSPVYFMDSNGFSDTWGGVIEDPAGTLVCMASDGGDGSEGALFKYVLSTFTATQLVPFSFSNGANPTGRLLKASNGLFYGLTSSGGNNSGGILFSIDPATGTFTLRQHFSTAIGTVPLGALTEVSGKLYGVCSSGGSTDGGTLFEYTIASNTLVSKVEFSLTAAGTIPQNGLFKASNGKLYGSTSASAVNGQGAFFEYTPGATVVTKRRDFSLADGSQPLGDVMQASNGLLYGTTSANGSFGKGTIFSYNTTSNTFTTLYHFNGLEGGTPGGDLLQASNGKLYGVFKEEGLGSSGGLFSWTITPGTYTEEYDFNVPPTTTEGKLPDCSLVQGSDGLLYGTTYQGGANDLGLIFRFSPTALTCTTLQTFTGTANGSLPSDGLTTESVVAPSSVTVAPKVFLEGPFVSATGKMNTNLRTLADFPLTEPFTAAGFTIVGGGGETINASVLSTTGDNAVVDWVLVELRDASNSATIVRTKAALLQSDGDVVSTDNSSTLSIPMAPGNYFVAVRQRNHFGVMTGNAVALAVAPTTLDFTTGALGTYGTNAQKTVTTYRVNWAGNTVRNTNIKYTGSSNDRDPILVRVGSTTPNNVVTGYYIEDVNLNGTVQYTGSGNDRDPILVNVGSTTPNNSITEQLP